jgi:hypothetical protein
MEVGMRLIFLWDQRTCGAVCFLKLRFLAKVVFEIHMGLCLPPISSKKTLFGGYTGNFHAQVGRVKQLNLVRFHSSYYVSCTMSVRLPTLLRLEVIMSERKNTAVGGSCLYTLTCF